MKKHDAQFLLLFAGSATLLIVFAFLLQHPMQSSAHEIKEEDSSALQLHRIPSMDAKFEYAGEEFQIPTLLPIYKKMTGGLELAGLLGQIAQTDFTLLDIGSFDALSIDSLVLQQERTKGYTINISLIDETIFISPNWNQWGDRVYQPVEEKDLPEDSALIASASAFLAEHGIDLEQYGDPVVDRAFLQYQTTEPLMAPAELNIIYPLAFHGLHTYEQFGSLYGLSVGVNTRTLEIMRVSNLTTLEFEETKGDLISSIDALIKQLNQDAAAQPDAPVIKLGNPQLVYVRAWGIDDQGLSVQQFVPGLRFGVIEKPEEYPWMTDHLIVPLNKDNSAIRVFPS